MAVFNIKLSANFLIPDNIRAIKDDEWEVIIMFISEMFLKHDANFTSTTKDGIENFMRKQYENELNAAKHRNMEQENEINKLKAQNTSIIERLKHENNDKLQKETQRLIEEHTYELKSKNDLIDKLKANSHERSNSHETELANIKEYYEKHIKYIESTIKQQLEIRYESENKGLHNDNIKLQEEKTKLEEFYTKRIALSQKQLEEQYEIERNTKKSYEEHVKFIENELKQRLESRYELDAKNLKNDNAKLIEDKIKLEEACEKRIKLIETDIKQRLENYYELENKGLHNENIKLLEEKTKLEAQFETKIANAEKHIASQLESKYVLEQKYIERELLSQKETINQLIKDKEKIEESFMREIKVYKNTLETLEQNSKEQASTKELLTNIQQAIAPKQQKNATEIGQVGEEKVLNILKNNKEYKKAKIDLVAKLNECGDIYFEFGNLRCLIEVKNKETLQYKSDMDKFIRDIEQQHAENKINCAIFISLKTNNFLNGLTQETLQLVNINGIPAVYIYLTEETVLYSAIILLENILSIRKNTTNAMDRLTKKCNDLYGVVKSMIDRINKAIVYHKKELMELQKQKVTYEQICKNIEDEHLETKQEKTERQDKPEKTEKQEVIDEPTRDVNDLLRTLSTEEKKPKNTYEQAKLIAMPIMTKEMVDEFLEYKKKNGKYPKNREELLASGLVTRNFLDTKLNKIYVASFSKFLSRFCDEYYETKPPSK